jgi:hypothetical protein
MRVQKTYSEPLKFCVLGYNAVQSVKMSPDISEERIIGGVLLCYLLYAQFLLGILLGPEDLGVMSFRNVIQISSDNTALFKEKNT